LIALLRWSFSMTPSEDAASASGSASRSTSPWTTIWLSPRQTIERIVATRPTYLVLPLAMLGMVAGVYVQLASVGLAGPLGIGGSVSALSSPAPSSVWSGCFHRP
jgi:hypothetical protein